MRYNSSLSMLFLAIVCASVSLSSFAQPNEDYSLNIIGFQKVTVPPNPELQVASTPFQATNDNIDIVIGAQLTGSDQSDRSDKVLMFNPTNQGYETYFIGGGTSNADFDGKWFTESFTPATDALIPPGRGLWIISIQGFTQTVVLAGDVVNMGAMTNHIYTGLQLISYPYSKPILINDTKFAANGGYGNDSADSADNILLWDVTAQAYVRYFLGGLSDVTNSNFDGKWFTESFDPATNVYLNPGRGFWYRHIGSGFDWIEPKPYTP